MGRPKKDPTVMHSFRIKPETAESLKQVAIECGFQYGDTAAMGEFLDRLAEIDRQLLKLIIKKT
jgi:tRNA(Phe) wybutosine-synthesizing methylase Tyw3